MESNMPICICIETIFHADNAGTDVKNYLQNLNMLLLTTDGRILNDGSIALMFLMYARYTTINNKLIEQVFEILMADKPDINYKSPSGFTALSYACQTRRANLTIIRRLVEEGADVNSQCYDTHSTPIHIFCFWMETDDDNIECLEWMVSEYGADMNLPNLYGVTPLMRLVKRMRCSHETQFIYRTIVIDDDDIENSLLGRLLRWTDVQEVDTPRQKLTESMTPCVKTLFNKFVIKSTCSYVLK